MSKPQPLKTISIPTLGRAVKLGELYDARTNQFLKGLVLDQTVIAGAHSSRPIPNSDIFLDMATSFEDKSSVLDIKAQLAVDILGGLVSISGSARYLKDTSTSTEQRSWAMGYKYRDREETFVYTNDSVKDHVVDLGKYLEKNVTHFVSAIEYGADVVVSLTERRAENEEEESISGQLQIDLNGLKGFVDVSGGAAVDVTGKFKSVNEMCQIKVHIDAKLDKVPTNAQEVLNFFSESPELIGTGVPVFVTLTPITVLDDKLSIKIRELKDTILNTVLRVFGELDDVISRFYALSAIVKPNAELVPFFVSSLDRAFTQFVVQHTRLVALLSKFLHDFHTNDTAPDDPAAIIKEVQTLLDLHASQRSPISLNTLEKAWDSFHDLHFVMENRKLKLNTLEEVQLVTLNETIIALFVITDPLTIDNISRFSYLVRDGVKDLKEHFPGVPHYFLYIESPELLKELPCYKDIVTKDGVGLFLSQIEGTTFSWRSLPVPFNYEVTGGPRVGFFWNQQDIPDLDVNAPLTLLVRARVNAEPSQSTLATLSFWRHDVWDTARLESRVSISCSRGLYIIAYIYKGEGNDPVSGSTPKVVIGNTFEVALVYTGSYAIMYLNGERIWRESFSQDWVGASGIPFIQVPYDGSGKHVEYARLYPKALTEEDVARLYKNN